MSRYLLKDSDDGDWYEVSKRQWVLAERLAGFHNTMGRPNEPATASFSCDREGLHLRGKIEDNVDSIVREFLKSKGLTSEPE